MQWSHILVRCWRLPSSVIIELAPNPQRRAGQGDKLAARKKKKLADPSHPSGRFLVDFCWKRTKLDLVGGLEHGWIMRFHSVGNFIIPTDELIFFRGVG